MEYPPYYYDVKGGNSYSLSGGIKLKNFKKISPIFEIGLETNNYFLRHFGGIVDTIKHIYSEDKFKFKNTFITAKAMVSHDLIKDKLVMIAGVKLSTVVNETEYKSSYLLTGEDTKETQKISSSETDIKSGDNFLLNANLILNIPILHRLDIGIEGSYGISYSRNLRDNDFLARQVVLNLKFRYLLP